MNSKKSTRTTLVSGKGTSGTTSKTKKPAPAPAPKVEPADTDHRFVKKNFSHPTWCQFADKFIWGLNKSGYECKLCSMKVSRHFIAEAKTTVCGAQDSGALVVEMPTANETTAVTKGQYFTIYLPHGAKKSVILKPSEPLRNVLEKVCQARGINMDEFVAEDSNGQAIDLDIVLGKIEGNEITFTKRDNVAPSTPSKEKTTKPATKPNDDHEKHDPKKKVTEASMKSSRRKSQPVPDKSKTAGTRAMVTTGSMPVVQPPVKKSIIEQYELGPELGSGAFSVVRSATHADTKKVVAIKVLDKYEDDDEQTQKFKQEIDIISSLQHENIVQFFELDEDEDNFYVVMELVGGGELFDYIIDSGTIPEKEAVGVVAQVLRAIEYMHSVGTAHRDLKPENLLYKTKAHDVIKIADFGESKSFREGSLTTYCGTPDYMAPEIIKGDPYGPEVDVWAIGVITYVMLAGFPPFDGENDVEVFASILAIRYDFPSPEWDNISQEACDFISSIFVDDPKKRLTASEALRHPWLVKNVPAELNWNSSSSPRTQMRSRVDSTMKVVADQEAFVGELKTMSQILECTAGNRENNLERKIYESYWQRLGEVQRLCQKKK